MRRDGCLYSKSSFSIVSWTARFKSTLLRNQCELLKKVSLHVSDVLSPDSDVMMGSDSQASLLVRKSGHAFLFACFNH